MFEPWFWKKRGLNGVHPGQVTKLPNYLLRRHVSGNKHFSKNLGASLLFLERSRFRTSWFSWLKHKILFNWHVEKLSFRIVGSDRWRRDDCCIPAVFTRMFDDDICVSLFLFLPWASHPLKALL